MVPKAGLEPARVSPLRPQHSVSTSSTTSALLIIFCRDCFLFGNNSIRLYIPGLFSRHSYLNWSNSLHTFMIDPPVGLAERYARLRDVTIKITAENVVIFPSKGAGPDPPKTVCAAPPKAAPISAPLPVCMSTIRISVIDTNTCSVSKNVSICFFKPFSVLNSL